MKTVFTILILSAAACLPVRGQGQLVLNAGDTFTYEFSSLPLLRIDPTGFFNVSASFVPTISGYSQIDAVQIEAFENTTTDAPLCSFQYGPQTACSMPGAWQDLQGVVQFTVTQGSVTLESMSFHVETARDAFSHNVYDLTVVPVPEPTVLSLMGIIVAVGLVWRSNRRKHDHMAQPAGANAAQTPSAGRQLERVLK